MADNPRIEELRRRVETDPASIAFAQLAEEYRRAGHFEEAVRVCRGGLERHPSYLSARVTLGRALIELGEHDDARTELEYVLRSAPENLAAIRGLAEIHQRSGNLNEALRQYQTALGIARHDPELEESVHDLSRQLGAPPAAVPPLDPPPPAIELPAAYDARTGEAQLAENDEAPASAASLSPELEAAADEFTKALQALDALLVDPPDAAPVDRPPQMPAAAIAPPRPPDAESDQPELSDDLMPVDASPVADEGSRGGSSAASVVNELEAWLEAIVLDRSERAGSADPELLRSQDDPAAGGAASDRRSPGDRGVAPGGGAHGARGGQEDPSIVLDLPLKTP